MVGYEKGKIEHIAWYRGYEIVKEHNLNIFYEIESDDYPIYTICKMGRIYQGTVDGVKRFIDDMFLKYGDC